MNVIVLHQHYWPENAATAQILTDLCEDLVAAGHEVTVICGQPSYRVTRETVRLPAREIRRGVSIERVWSYTPPARGIPQRLAHYTSYFGSSLLTALLAKKPDVCLVMSTPPLLLGVSGLLLRLLKGVPFVYSVQDLYPDIAVHLGVLREGSAVTRGVGVVATRCYQASPALVTLSPGMARSLVAKGVAPERVHVIPNWADTASVEPIERDNAFALEHGLDRGFVVQYSGNLGQSQGLETVLDAAALLTDLPMSFVLVGDGNARARLESLAKARDLQNVRFLPPQPRERLSELLSACDVALVPMKRGVGDDLVPSKLYGIMAAGRPVLASVEPASEVARVVREHDCGWIVEPEDGRALAEGLRRAFSLGRVEHERLGRNGREACVEHYSRTAMTRRYEQALRMACGLGAGATEKRSRAEEPFLGKAQAADEAWPLSH